MLTFLRQDFTSHLIMNFSWLILSLLCPQAALSCVVAHVKVRHCYNEHHVGEDVVAQVWDNGVLVCNGTDKSSWRDISLPDFRKLIRPEGDFHIDGCKKRISFGVDSVGGFVTYRNRGKYTTRMLGTGQSRETMCAPRHGMEFKGWEYEACFSDNWGDCQDYPSCSRCNFKASC